MNGVPSFDRTNGQPVDVCLVVEGCYPHVAGGVSSWVDWLIRSQPKRSFAIVSVVSGSAKRKSLYDYPDNVLRFDEVALDPAPPKERASRRTNAPDETEAPALVSAFCSVLRDGDGAALDTILEATARSTNPLRPWHVGDTPLMWSVACGVYEKLTPQAGFSDFFWAFQALAGGLVAALSADLPPARIYHAACTGFAGLIVARAARQNGARSLVTEHGIYTNERRIEIAMAEWIVDTIDYGLSPGDGRIDVRSFWIGSFESFARLCYDACSHITTLFADNQSLQQALGAPSQRLLLIPNGVDVQRFARFASREPEGPPTITLLGRVVPIKDIETFLEAVLLVRQSVPDVRAIVAGPEGEDESYARRCRALAKTLGIESAVEFVGRIQAEDALEQTHLMVLTSLSEGQPLSILEAGAAGRPCVTTNAGACREIIEKPVPGLPDIGPGGIVVDILAPDQVAQAIASLLQDAPIRRQMGQALRARITHAYTTQQAAAGYSALYDNTAPPARKHTKMAGEVVGPIAQATAS